MKTLNKLNLAYLNRRELDDREMNALRGGDGNTCVCNNCVNVASGDNRSANLTYGYTTSGGYDGVQPGGSVASCDCESDAEMVGIRVWMGTYL